LSSCYPSFVLLFFFFPFSLFFRSPFRTHQ
jgi:hypothetical protein